MRVVKKILRTVINIIFGAFVAAFLGVIIMYTMGIKGYMVLSGSMEPVIQTGSVSFVDMNYSFHKVETGDIIAFEAENGMLVLHRAINIEDGLIETKGDNNEVTDGYTTSEDNFEGLVKFSIPYAGYMCDMLMSQKGMIIGITIFIFLALADSLLADKSPRIKKNTEKTEKNASA